MSKDIASAPLIGPIASVFGASPLGQAIKIPKTPAPPPPPPPAEMPDPGDVLKRKKREAAATAAVSGSGRAGTILSDIRDRLGG